jgi:hypothetical protein
MVWQNNCISQLFQLNWSTERLDTYQIVHASLITHVRLGALTALFIWPNDCD